MDVILSGAKNLRYASQMLRLTAQHDNSSNNRRQSNSFELNKFQFKTKNSKLFKYYTGCMSLSSILHAIRPTVKPCFKHRQMQMLQRFCHKTGIVSCGAHNHANREGRGKTEETRASHIEGRASSDKSRDTSDQIAVVDRLASQIEKF
jgi:hypothetical protein